MKLLSPTDFIYKNGEFYYSDRHISAILVNVKSKLTLNCHENGGRSVVLPQGVYSIDELKKQMTLTK